MSVQEKRRYFRIHFKRQVQISFSTQAYDKCQVKNISLGGMFVEGTFPDKTEEECHINLVQKTKNAYLAFKALAKVVRKEDEGIALEFVSMSFKSLLSLEMILLFEPSDTTSESDIELPKDLPFEVYEDDSSILDL